MTILLFVSCNQDSDKGSLNDTNKNGQSFSIGEKFSIHSDILDEDREVWIYVPEGFYDMNETDLQYPVVYVVDGENLFLPTVGVVQQLSSPFCATDLSPQMIVVGIPNIDRNRDFAPTNAMIFNDPSTLEVTGGADAFTEFIEKELFPFVEEKYSTAPYRTIIGHSLGGLFIMNTLVHHSHLFNSYLAMDSQLSWDEGRFREDALQHIKNDVFQNKNLFMATANNKYPWMSLQDVKGDTSLVMRMMRSLLLFEDDLKNVQPNGLDIQMTYYPNENHYQVPMPALYDGLRYLFSDHSFPEMAQYYSPENPKGDENLMKDFTAHFEMLSVKMGYEVKPAESYVNAWAFGFLQLGKPQIAEALLDLNIKNYPNSTHVHPAKAEYLERIQNKKS